jgi:hypothetical protein
MGPLPLRTDKRDALVDRWTQGIKNLAQLILGLIEQTEVIQLSAAAKSTRTSLTSSLRHLSAMTSPLSISCNSLKRPRVE